jgi:hypothetical protein
MIGLAFLVVCGLYVCVALFVAKQVGKGTNSKFAKYATIAVFVLIPLWDIIPGKLYFQHLCETEAGVKVFKTVEVDQSYFKSNGKPDEKKFAERYPHVSKFDRNFSPIFHIAKTESMIQDKQTEEILGTAKNFSHRSGWLNTFILVDAAGASCPAYPLFGMHSAVLEGVFRPSTS